MLVYVFLKFDEYGHVKTLLIDLEDLTALTKSLLNNGGIIESLEYEEADDSMNITVKFDE